jgi:hypothetical protein
LAQVVVLLTGGLLQVDGFLFQLMLAEEGYMPVELNLALAIGIQERTEERYGYMFGILVCQLLKFRQ